VTPPLPGKVSKTDSSSADSSRLATCAAPIFRPPSPSRRSLSSLSLSFQYSLSPVFPWHHLPAPSVPARPRPPRRAAALAIAPPVRRPRSRARTREARARARVSPCAGRCLRTRSPRCSPILAKPADPVRQALTSPTLPAAGGRSAVRWIYLFRSFLIHRCLYPVRCIPVDHDLKDVIAATMAGRWPVDSRYSRWIPTGSGRLHSARRRRAAAAVGRHRQPRAVSAARARPPYRRTPRAQRLPRPRVVT
jgi:hypothetical protein